MYDDLVKRLRILSGTDNISEFDEAADAIEKMTEDNNALNGTITNLLEQIKDLGKPRWIPVTERLPKFEGAVLCMRKSNVYGVRPYQEILYIDEFGFKNFDDIYLADGVVTHWMPLPQPPEEE